MVRDMARAANALDLKCSAVLLLLILKELLGNSRGIQTRLRHINEFVEGRLIHVSNVELGAILNDQDIGLLAVLGILVGSVNRLQPALLAVEPVSAAREGSAAEAGKVGVSGIANLLLVGAEASAVAAEPEVPVGRDIYEGNRAYASAPPTARIGVDTAAAQDQAGVAVAALVEVDIDGGGSAGQGEEGLGETHVG